MSVILCARVYIKSAVLVSSEDLEHRISRVTCNCEAALTAAIGSVLAIVPGPIVNTNPW